MFTRLDKDKWRCVIVTRPGEVYDDEVFGDVRAACGLRERDIDLLLLEELHCSPQFRAWFLRRVTGCSLSVDFNAQHSVAHTLGESDLEVKLSDDKHSSWVLLVENKLCAEFQKEQPERYQQRAARYLEAGADHAMTVLLSPSTYHRGGCDRFHKQLSYEEIRDWLVKSNGGVRAEYKARLLSAAINKALEGYTPVPDRKVSDFWQEYWILAEQEAPELQMQEPATRPARAGFIRFHPLELPRGIRFIHKIRKGHMDIEFSGFGKRLPELQNAYGSYLEPNMSITKATGSGAIRIAVHPLDPKLPFAPQAQEATTAISMARTMSKWFQSAKVEWPPAFTR
jgi:hypothetical protein